MLRPGARITGSATDSGGRQRFKWSAVLSYEPVTGAQGWDLCAVVDGKQVQMAVVLNHDAQETEVVRHIAQHLAEEMEA